MYALISALAIEPKGFLRNFCGSFRGFVIVDPGVLYGPSVGG